VRLTASDNLNGNLQQCGAEGGFDLVHADTLRYFPELVKDLGGDAEALLRHLGIDTSLLAQGRSSFGYRSWVNLLEHAATQAHCPDFGMRLAMLQGGGNVFGPMGEVMKHSNTLGEAVDYVANHCYAHSLAARVRVMPDQVKHTLFVGHEILLDRLPSKCQAIEQVLLLGHLNAVEITGGRARVREVRFRHQPLSPLRVYRRNFGCDVRFDQPEDGVVFFERDRCCQIVNSDVHAYETATSFIASRFPRVSPPMHAQVRGAILRFIGTDCCSNDRVAAELRLHSRTLHRRLRAEGKSFTEIKDEVRRDLALYCLQQTELELTYVAQKIGYAEHSELSRSCMRWYGASPSQLRSQTG
jgi:AraC-like DNA-binding protein